MKGSNLQDSLPESTGFVSFAVLKSIFSLSKEFFYTSLSLSFDKCLL